jgi:hypothetical protein
MSTVVPKCYGLLFGKGTTLQEIQTIKKPENTS